MFLFFSSRKDGKLDLAVGAPKAQQAFVFFDFKNDQNNARPPLKIMPPDGDVVSFGVSMLRLGLLCSDFSFEIVSACMHVFVNCLAKVLVNPVGKIFWYAPRLTRVDPEVAVVLAGRFDTIKPPNKASLLPSTMLHAQQRKSRSARLPPSSRRKS